MPAPRKPFSKENFLLWMLASIFCFQAALFAGGMIRCATLKSEEIRVVCPDIGRRYDQTFGVMIATVLALLGTSKKENTN